MDSTREQENELLMGMQKKTFTKWINCKLHHRKVLVDDLYEDIKDGSLLIDLLEVLTRKKMIRSSHFFDDKAIKQQQNLVDVFRCLKANDIQVGYVQPSDIGTGAADSILSLVWNIIHHFQIQEAIADGFADVNGDMVDSGTRGEDFDKEQLLAWVRTMLSSEDDPEVEDFGVSWRDGTAFLALVRHLSDNLHLEDDFDLEQNFLDSPTEDLDNKSRLKLAFTLAEDKLGVARILDPEDVDVAVPDQRCIMMYVAQFVVAQHQQRFHIISHRHQSVHYHGEAPSAFWFFVIPTAIVFLAVFVKMHIQADVS